MNLPPQTSKQDQDGFFRCPVQSENSKATICVGRRKSQASVQETSIDGFTVLVSPRDASKLSVGRTWVMEYEGTRTEVHPQWFFNAPDGHVQMGLRRLRDLTKPDPIRSSLLTRFGGKRCEDPSYAAAIFGGFVLLLFSLMALPGLGDRLGTSDRIQDAFRWVIKGVDDSLGNYL
ncbi:MAG: hypothetical protein AB8B91_02320 [Rubripirellula sp.]